MNDHPQSDIPKPENTGLLDQILNYIELHLSEDLSLASISAQFMVSQSTVSQLFKKQRHRLLQNRYPAETDRI